MRRLQNRLGLGEIHLPDERKRPVPAGPADAAGGRRRPAVARTASTARPHPPRRGGSARRGQPAGCGPPPAGIRPPAQDTPSAAGTTKMRAPGRPEPKEPPTTRFSAQPNPAPRPAPARPPTPAAHRRPNRPAAKTAKSSPGSANCGGAPTTGARAAPATAAVETVRRPDPGDADSDVNSPAGQRPDAEDDATTAIPTPRGTRRTPTSPPQKLNARGKDAEDGDRTRQRRGGGLSAQDLLRREGRTASSQNGSGLGARTPARPVRLG